jgi:hypothetical protein
MWASLAAGAASPEDRAETSDLQGRISRSLASLPPEQSRALVLAAVYGYTAVEISQVESVPLGTAKTRVRRGLQKLRASESVRELAGGAQDLTGTRDLTGSRDVTGSRSGRPLDLRGPDDVAKGGAQP